MLGASLVMFGLSCAAIIPDYNVRFEDNTDKNPRTEIIMSPWGGQVCDQKQRPDGKHFVLVTFIVNQLHKEAEGVFLMDNGAGSRFDSAQSATFKVPAGVGNHVVKVGLYKYNDDGKIVVTWQRSKVYSVVCCHNVKPSPRRAMGGYHELAFDSQGSR